MGEEKSFVAAIFGLHIAPCDQPQDPEQFARDIIGKGVYGYKFGSLFGPRQSEEEAFAKWRIVRTDIIRDIPDWRGDQKWMLGQIIAHCVPVEAVQAAEKED